MNRRIILFAPAVLLASTLLLWGCPKKTDVTASPEDQTEAVPAQEQPAEVQPAEEQPAVFGGVQFVLDDLDGLDLIGANDLDRRHQKAHDDSAGFPLGWPIAL